jgi:hypothetical protein
MGMQPGEGDSLVFCSLVQLFELLHTFQCHNNSNFFEIETCLAELLSFFHLLVLAHACTSSHKITYIILMRLW